MIHNKLKLIIAIASLAFIMMSCASSKKGYKGCDCPTFSSVKQNTEINARG